MTNRNGYDRILTRLEGFYRAQETALTVSFAQSLDGAIAFSPGTRTILSNDASLRMTHGLRACHDAVLVGVGTVLSDDPRLTVRGPCPQGQPARVVLDRTLRTPADAALFQCPEGGPVCIATRTDVSDERQRALEAAGATIWRWEESDFEPCALRSSLARHGIRRAMLEGGATLISHVLDSRCFDYTVITISPQLHPGADAVRYTTGRSVHTFDLTHCEQTLLQGDIILDGPVR
ncbi:MAG: dihydrofolate reductase family protein [Myxococcota bacterium]